MNAASSALRARLGLRWPIVQAPMAGVSSPAMAAAASNAGALGSIAIGAADPAAAGEMIAAVRAATRRPFNVNLFCHRPARRRPAVERAWIAALAPRFAALGADPPDRLEEIYRSFTGNGPMTAMLLDARPPVVSFHFGLPAGEQIDALRDAGCFLMATATSPGEARAIEAAGLDAIVAQGWEAGGHRGCFDPDAPDQALGTAVLARLIAKRSRLPVIAAGAVMDGAGVAAMLRLGAAAVQLGTAFLLCDESLADDGYRSAILEAERRGTVMTRAISGRPARCLANLYTDLGSGLPRTSVPDYPLAYDLAKALHATGLARGEAGFGAHWAGQGAPLARGFSTEAMVEQLAAELDGCG